MANSVTAFFLNESLLYNMYSPGRQMFEETLFLSIIGDCKICECKRLTEM